MFTGCQCVYPLNTWCVFQIHELISAEDYFTHEAQKSQILNRLMTTKPWSPLLSVQIQSLGKYVFPLKRFYNQCLGRKKQYLLFLTFR